MVATRSIQSSFICHISGSTQERVDKLRPQSFSSRVLAHEDSLSKKLSFVRRATRITAQRSARVEPEVVPVSPEDVPKVCGCLSCSVYERKKDKDNSFT